MNEQRPKDHPLWRGYCECLWDNTRSKVVQVHPGCRFHAEQRPSKPVYGPADLRQFADELIELENTIGVSAQTYYMRCRFMVRGLREAADEIERLRAEVDRLKTGFEGACYCCEPVGEMNQQLRAALERTLRRLEETRIDTKWVRAAVKDLREALRPADETPAVSRNSQSRAESLEGETTAVQAGVKLYMHCFRHQPLAFTVTTTSPTVPLSAVCPVCEREAENGDEQ